MARKTYREMNEELEEIVEQLQAGNLDIEESLKWYERGMELVRHMEQYLKTAETKITKLKVQLNGADADE